MGLAAHEFDISPEQLAGLAGLNGSDGVRLQNLQDEIAARVASLRNAAGTIASAGDLRTVGRRLRAIPRHSRVGRDLSQDPESGAAGHGRAGSNGLLIGGGLVGFGPGLFSSKGPGGNPAGQSTGDVPSRAYLEQEMDLSLQRQAALDRDHGKLDDRFQRTGRGGADLDANEDAYDSETKHYRHLGAVWTELYAPIKVRHTPPRTKRPGLRALHLAKLGS